MNQFSIGETLGTGFRIWLKNLPAFFVLTALVYSPVIIWGISVFWGTPSDVEAWARSVDRFVKLQPLAILPINILVTSAVCYGVVRELQGQHASMPSSIGVGIARFFPVLLVAVVETVAIFAGLIALIVPGIILMCMFYVATPAAVCERPGIGGALSRSSDLTRGHRLEIFGFLVILGVLDFAVRKLVEHTFVNEHAEDVFAMFRTYLIFDLIRVILLASLGAVMAAVAYYMLRREKEGTSASELGKVFE